LKDLIPLAAIGRAYVWGAGGTGQRDYWLRDNKLGQGAEGRGQRGRRNGLQDHETTDYRTTRQGKEHWAEGKAVPEYALRW